MNQEASHQPVVPQSQGLSVLAVLGTPSKKSASRTALNYVAADLEKAGCEVRRIDFARDPLPLFNPETTFREPAFHRMRDEVRRADVYVLATPDYHGCMSGSMKNFLDHFWKELAGKLLVSIVASNDKGLTVTDQLRTAARQCYCWCLPYGVSFAAKDDITEEGVPSQALEKRLGMLSADVQTYGRLLSRQRALDLESKGPGFLRPTATQ